jgi:hypothetical protein
MVESICGQGFAYTRKVEEDRQKKLVKLGLEATETVTVDDLKSAPKPALPSPIYKRPKACLAVQGKSKSILSIRSASRQPPCT